jgi:hypothetical protein
MPGRPCGGITTSRNGSVAPRERWLRIAVDFRSEVMANTPADHHSCHKLRKQRLIGINPLRGSKPRGLLSAPRSNGVHPGETVNRLVEDRLRS